MEEVSINEWLLKIILGYHKTCSLGSDLWKWWVTNNRLVDSIWKKCQLFSCLRHTLLTWVWFLKLVKHLFKTKILSLVDILLLLYVHVIVKCTWFNYKSCINRIAYFSKIYEARDCEDIYVFHFIQHTFWKLALVMVIISVCRYLQFSSIIVQNRSQLSHPLKLGMTVLFAWLMKSPQMHSAVSSLEGSDSFAMLSFSDRFTYHWWLRW